MRRALLMSLLLALLVSLVAVVPVAAAVPANDTLAGAVPIALGTDLQEDTTEATTGTDEAAFNDLYCGAPALAHGVWFTIMPTVTDYVKFDVSASDYGVGVLLFDGLPSAGNAIACGPQVVVAPLAGGATYYALAFGDGTTTATSGNLHLVVSQGFPPPEISVTVDRRGTVDKTGVAHISGTVTCSSGDVNAILFDVFGDVRQRIGRIFITGFFDAFLETPCDGSTQRWDAFVSADNGLFAGGKAATIAIGFGCNDLCSDAFTEATVQLNKKGK